MSFGSRLYKIVRSPFDMGAQLGDFVWDGIKRLPDEDFDAIDSFWESWRDNVMGQSSLSGTGEKSVIGGAFGPEGVIGSVIGALPQEGALGTPRRTGGAIWDPSMQALQWTYKNGVDRPIGTLATIYNIGLAENNQFYKDNPQYGGLSGLNPLMIIDEVKNRISDGTGESILFDWETYNTVWNMTDGRSSGQALILALRSTNILDPEEVKQEMSTEWYQIGSGIIDFNLNIVGDPAFLAAKAARASYANKLAKQNYMAGQPFAEAKQALTGRTIEGTPVGLSGRNPFSPFLDSGPIRRPGRKGKPERVIQRDTAFYEKWDWNPNWEKTVHIPTVNDAMTSNGYVTYKQTVQNIGFKLLDELSPESQAEINPQYLESGELPVDIDAGPNELKTDLKLNREGVEDLETPEILGDRLPDETVEGIDFVVRQERSFADNTAEAQRLWNEMSSDIDLDGFDPISLPEGIDPYSSAGVDPYFEKGNLFNAHITGLETNLNNLINHQDQINNYKSYLDDGESSVMRFDDDGFPISEGDALPASSADIALETEIMQVRKELNDALNLKAQFNKATNNIEIAHIRRKEGLKDLDGREVILPYEAAPNPTRTFVDNLALRLLQAGRNGELGPGWSKWPVQDAWVYSQQLARMWNVGDVTGSAWLPVDNYMRLRLNDPRVVEVFERQAELLAKIMFEKGGEGLQALHNFVELNRSINIYEDVVKNKTTLLGGSVEVSVIYAQEKLIELRNLKAKMEAEDADFFNSVGTIVNENIKSIQADGYIDTTVDGITTRLEVGTFKFDAAIDELQDLTKIPWNAILSLRELYIKNILDAPEFAKGVGLFNPVNKYDEAFKGYTNVIEMAANEIKRTSHIPIVPRNMLPYLGPENRLGFKARTFFENSEKGNTAINSRALRITVEKVAQGIANWHNPDHALAQVERMFRDVSRVRGADNISILEKSGLNVDDIMIQFLNSTDNLQSMVKLFDEIVENLIDKLVDTFADIPHPIKNPRGLDTGAKIVNKQQVVEILRGDLSDAKRLYDEAADVAEAKTFGNADETTVPFVVDGATIERNIAISPSQLRDSSVIPRFDMYERLIEMVSGDYKTIINSDGVEELVHIGSKREVVRNARRQATMYWKKSVLLTPRWQMVVNIDSLLRTVATVGAAATASRIGDRIDNLRTRWLTKAGIDVDAVVEKELFETLQTIELDEGGLGPANAYDRIQIETRQLNNSIANLNKTDMSVRDYINNNRINMRDDNLRDAINAVDSDFFEPDVQGNELWTDFERFQTISNYTDDTLISPLSLENTNLVYPVVYYGGPAFDADMGTGVGIQSPQPAPIFGNSIFHGAYNAPSKMQSFVDNATGELILKPSSNFDGQQRGVSFSSGIDEAWDYAGRTKGGGPGARNSGLVFEINAEIIPEGMLDVEISTELEVSFLPGSKADTRGLTEIRIPAEDFRAIHIADKDTIDTIINKDIEEQTSLQNMSDEELAEAYIRTEENAEVTEAYSDTGEFVPNNIYRTEINRRWQSILFERINEKRAGYDNQISALARAVTTSRWISNQGFENSNLIPTGDEIIETLIPRESGSTFKDEGAQLSDDILDVDSWIAGVDNTDIDLAKVDAEATPEMTRAIIENRLQRIERTSGQTGMATGQNVFVAAVNWYNKNHEMGTVGYEIPYEDFVKTIIDREYAQRRRQRRTGLATGAGLFFAGPAGAAAAGAIYNAYARGSLANAARKQISDSYGQQLQLEGWDMIKRMEDWERNLVVVRTLDVQDQRSIVKDLMNLDEDLAESLHKTLYPESVSMPDSWVPDLPSLMDEIDLAKWLGENAKDRREAANLLSIRADLVTDYQKNVVATFKSKNPETAGRFEQAATLLEESGYVSQHVGDTNLGNPWGDTPQVIAINERAVSANATKRQVWSDETTAQRESERYAGSYQYDILIPQESASFARAWNDFMDRHAGPSGPAGISPNRDFWRQFWLGKTNEQVIDWLRNEGQSVLNNLPEQYRSVEGIEALVVKTRFETQSLIPDLPEFARARLKLAQGIQVKWDVDIKPVLDLINKKQELFLKEVIDQNYLATDNGTFTLPGLGGLIQKVLRDAPDPLDYSFAAQQILNQNVVERLRNLEELKGSNATGLIDFGKTVTDSSFLDGVETISNIAKVKQVIDNVLDKAFENLTMVEDIVSRGTLYESLYEAQMAMELQPYRRGDGTYRLNGNDIEDLRARSRRKALKETKNVLYDLAERTRFEEVMSEISPFLGAWTEVTSRWMGIAAENPVFVARALRSWDIITAEDENGNSMFVFQMPGVFDADNPVLPEIFGRKIFGDLSMLANQQIDLSPKSASMIGALPTGGPIVNVVVTEVVMSAPNLMEIFDWLVPYGIAEGDNALLRIADAYTNSVVKNLTKKFGMDQDAMMKTKIRVSQDYLAQRFLNGESMPAPGKETDEFVEEVERRTQMIFGIKLLRSVAMPIAIQQQSPYYAILKDYWRKQDEIGLEEADDWLLEQHPELWASTGRIIANNGVRAGTLEGHINYERHEFWANLHGDVASGFITGKDGAVDVQFVANKAVQQIEAASGRRDYLPPEDVLKLSAIKIGWREYGVFRESLDERLRIKASAGGSVSLNAKDNFFEAEQLRTFVEELGAKNPQWLMEYASLGNVNKQKRILQAYRDFSDSGEFDYRVEMPYIEMFLNLHDSIAREMIKRSYGTSDKNYMQLSFRGNEDLRQRWDIGKMKILQYPDFSDIFDKYFSRMDTVMTGNLTKSLVRA
tara:strand:+ start:1982 stop:10228 length:8247 start_codon:yes stop_codon:yes gene_type:complete